MVGSTTVRSVRSMAGHASTRRLHTHMHTHVTSAIVMYGMYLAVSECGATKVLVSYYMSRFPSCYGKVHVD